MSTLTVRNPANGATVAELPQDNAQSIAAKHSAAHAAQPAWAAAPLPARIEALRAFRDALTAEVERLAAILTSETGKPIRQAKNEINGLKARIDFFLESTEATIAARDVHNAAGIRERISHEPLGVIANISAWNYPYFVGGNVFVPALLTGNAVLYKPSEFAALTGIEIGKLLHRSGVPPPVFAVVIGDGTVGAELIKQPIDGVFFTGSYATGQRIAKQAAGRMIPIQLELGGKDPVYICDDVDVAVAAAAMAEGAFYNAGQSCCAVERIYVHQAVAERFTSELSARVSEFVVGDPLDENTFIGPVARQAQLALLEGQIADARSHGGRVLCGGSRIDRRGWFFQPTVVAGATHEMTLMREESFGPVIGVQVVSGDDEAVELMNDTEYGLTAGVYTTDRDRAEAVLARVAVGTAYWNCCDRVSPRLPWSGRKHSGIGATLSTMGIRAFVRPKAYHLRQPSHGA